MTRLSHSIGRFAYHGVSRSALGSRTRSCLPSIYLNAKVGAAPISAPRYLSIGSSQWKALSSDQQHPSSKQAESPVSTTATAAAITESEYNALADTYLDKVVTRLEELQDEREDVDVEFSAGVLTVSFPVKGTYVINKQPPNKQIWLSSPVSGPKRYDWVAVTEGHSEKGGKAEGNWIYLRDRSSLDDIFRDEMGVDLSVPSPGHTE